MKWNETPLTPQFAQCRGQLPCSGYPWWLCQCQPRRLKQPPVRRESALCLCRWKVLVHVPFLSRCNLFIQQNVLLQWGADPTGILHCTVHHPCTLCYFAVGLSAPKTSPVKRTGQQLFSKQREEVYESHREICKDRVGIRTGLSSRSILREFAVKKRLGQTFFFGWMCLVSVSFFIVLPCSHCILISIGA